MAVFLVVNWRQRDLVYMLIYCEYSQSSKILLSLSDLISFTNVTSETETIPTTNKTGNIQKGTSSAIKVTYIFSSLDSFLIVIIFVLLILYYFERKKKRGHQRLPEDSISFLSLRS